MHSVRAFLFSLAIAFSAFGCAGSGSVPLTHVVRHGEFHAVAAQMEDLADRQYDSDVDRLLRARHHHAIPQCRPGVSSSRSPTSSRAS